MSIKGQGHSLTLVKDHSDFKVKTCFSQKQLDDFGTKVHMKAYWGMGMKIYINDLGHMTIFIFNFLHNLLCSKRNN